MRNDADTNTIEGFFGVFKRGMNGTCRHCSSEHLRRHIAEFDFRYHTSAFLGIDDAERVAIAVEAIEGKRLT